MAKRSWDKDRERQQMRGPTEEAFPKDEQTVFIKKPPPVLPDWMTDKKLLPKKPPGVGGPK